MIAKTRQSLRVGTSLFLVFGQVVGKVDILHVNFNRRVKSQKSKDTATVTTSARNLRFPHFLPRFILFSLSQRFDSLLLLLSSHRHGQRPTRQRHGKNKESAHSSSIDPKFHCLVLDVQSSISSSTLRKVTNQHRQNFRSIPLSLNQNYGTTNDECRSNRRRTFFET